MEMNSPAPHRRPLGQILIAQGVISVSDSSVSSSRRVVLPRRISATLLLTAASLLVGCTTHRVAAPASGNPPGELQIRVGDTIRLVTKYRERVTLRVTEIRNDEIEGVTQKPNPHETVPAGKKAVVPYVDLALVEVTRHSAGKTVGLVAVLTVVGAVVSGGVAVVPATAL